MKILLPLFLLIGLTGCAAPREVHIETHPVYHPTPFCKEYVWIDAWGRRRVDIRCY